MKFKKHVCKEAQEILEKEYKNYIKVTPCSQKEKRALREWVSDGNSVYENYYGAWADGQVPLDFLSVYRDDEYIREMTKNMTDEESVRFAKAYYGWDDVAPTEHIQPDVPLSLPTDGELPF